MENLTVNGGVNHCQLELESCGCNEASTPNTELGLLTVPQYHKNKRFSIIVEEELLRNGYPSLLIVNGQRHLSCNNLNNLPADKLNKTSYQVKLAPVMGGEGRANGAGGGVGGSKRDRNEESRSVSDSSDSYEMIEYGLNLNSTIKTSKNGKQSRRKSCLCWAPDVIFNDKEDSDCAEVFPQEITNIMDQYQSLIEPSRTSTTEKVVTVCLIFVTAVSVCFLFWYQNFSEVSSEGHHRHHSVSDSSTTATSEKH